MSSNISVPSGLQIKNCWTGAGIASFVHVTSADKSLNILFDCGSIEPSTLGVTHVLCTHGHLDHMGACVLHARARALQKKSVTYYVPEDCTQALLEQKQACEKLDGREIPMNIQSCKPGDSIPISKSFRIRVFKTVHRVPSQGYAIYYQPNMRLKPEFVGRPADEMRSLARSGVQLREKPEECLQLVYTGDTTFAGLMRPENEFVFESPILIMECTYLVSDTSSTDASLEKGEDLFPNRQGSGVSVGSAIGDLCLEDEDMAANNRTVSGVALTGERAKAVEFGHIHLDDIIDNATMFQRIQHLVLVHLSMKYQPYYRALEILRNRLPESILHKSYVAVKSLGSPYYLTKIASARRRIASTENTPCGEHEQLVRNGFSTEQSPGGHGRKRRDERDVDESEKRKVGYGWGSYKRTVRRVNLDASDSHSV